MPTGRKRSDTHAIPATVSTSFVNHVLFISQKKGCDIETLMSCANLVPEQLGDPIGRIPLCTLQSVLRRATEISGNPLLGLTIAANIRPSAFGVMGLAGMCSANLAEALSIISRFGKLVFNSNDGRIVISEYPDRVELADQLLCLPTSCNLLPEMLLLGWVSYLNFMLDSPLPLIEVNVTHTDQSLRAAHSSFFQCPINYAQPKNSIIFPKHLLSAPVYDADWRTHRTLVKEAQIQMSNLLSRASVSSRVYPLILEYLPQGKAHLDIVSKELAMSPRTLQRKLSEEGESYSRLLESVRIELAIEYLRHDTAAIFSLSARLGYSHPSAFSHAFRQATGMTPAEYRTISKSTSATPPLTSSTATPFLPLLRFAREVGRETSVER